MSIRGRNLCFGKRIAILLLFIIPLYCGFSAPAGYAATPQETELIKAAKNEREVTWYTTTNVSDYASLVKGFETKYPFMKLKIYRASGEKLINKVLIEARADKYPFDVISTGFDKFPILKEKDLIVPYLSGERDAFQKELKDPDGYWTALYINTHTMAYNTRLVSPKDAPRRYEDLLDPKWKGKLGMETNEVQWFAAQLEIMGKKKGLDFMRGLAGQKPAMRVGHTLLVQLLIAGEFPVAVNVYAPAVAKEMKKGAPVKWVPVEPVVFHAVTMMLGKRASHPYGAKLFIDYALSEEGQSKLRERGRIPCRTDVRPDPPELLEGLELHPIPFQEIGQNFNQLEMQFNEIFKK